MTKGKARHLSDIISQYADQGSNDGRWFFLEHQLYQVKASLTQARQLMETVSDRPENEEERELASSVLEFLTPAFIEFLSAHAKVLSLLAGTEVAERVGRMEDG